MGFSFDFTGERNVIVYQAEAGMVLDENIYRLLRSELMEEYICRLKQKIPVGNVGFIMTLPDARI